VRITRWLPAASTLRAAFIAASVAWMLLLVAAPFAASRPHASTLGALLVVSVYGVGSLVCHQLAERSYRLWTAQMPVCARCAGIYFGAAVASLMTLGARAAQASHRRPAVSAALHHARLILAVASTPTLLTLVYEWTTGVMPAHAIRALAGVPIGAAAAWLVVAAADNQVN
jgi:hypothetical protein